jgi:signal transduction histidine kinase/CheY-like chemotaxis protein
MSRAQVPPAIRGDARRLRRWVTIAGIALIALIIAADTYEGWQDYLRVITDNEHLQIALNRAVTEQTARMVQEADVALSSIGPDRMRLGLSRIARLPFVHSAFLAGADGQWLGGTPAAGPGQQSIRDLDLFRIPQTAGYDSLYVDRPWRDLAGSSTFAVSRRIDSTDGQFAGVAVARLSSDYLAEFYSRVNVNADTSILLARDDGVVLAQYPALQVMPLVLDSNQQVRHIDIGGREQIAVSQMVPGYPIVVVVYRSLSNVLKPWIQEERSSAARTLSLAVLAAILLLVLRSALNRQERADQEKHRLEQELAGAQRVEALGFLAASVAHDFNNVLTAIIGYAELAREAAEPGSSSGANIDRLLAATERARLLVRRVLTFDPHRSLSYRPTRIAPIVREVAQQVQATLPASINLQVQGLDVAATVFGDATEIYQVVMNLCSNAVHATPLGGSLQVRLENQEVHDSRALTLGQLRAGRWVCLSVTDTGVGLAEDQTTAIFEPFYTTRQRALGTGIGLTVVRTIVLRMNGALDVSSRPGAGTRMTVYWPSSEPSAETARPVRLADDGAGETIMVVDDERELVSLTEELLASLSYEPVGFSDGHLAIEVFRHDPKRFDAILTDEHMQPMRGLEIAKLIHELEPGLPIILMTGHRDDELDARAREAGVTEILDKPLRVQVLREALARQLQKEMKGETDP